MPTAQQATLLLLLPPPPPPPPAEPPFLPLSTAALHRLSSLPRAHGFPKLLATISGALSTLGASASSLAAPAPSVALSASRQSMLIALDQAARATVDQARAAEAMRDVLASVLGGAREAAREAQRQRQRRGRRPLVVGVGGPAEGQGESGGQKGDEEGDHRIAAAAGDGVAGRYEVEFGRWEGEYGALDLWTKYTKSPEYMSFKSTLRPAVSPLSGDQAEQSEERGEQGGGGGEAWFPKNFQVCPLTLRPIEARVTSKTCGHAFEEKAVRALLHGVGQARCPAAGCGRALSGDLLVADGGEERREKGGSE